MRNLKKKAGILFAALLAASMFAAGCSSPSGGAESTPAQTTAAQTTAAQTSKAASETQTTKAKDSSAGIESSVAEGTYYTRIEMGEGMSVILYLQVKDNGEFIFSRDTDFSSDEKGAGKVSGDEFIYSVVNGEEVKADERKSSFRAASDGSIEFTSPMWFGSTEPKISAEDGTVTYPVFNILTEEIKSQLEAEAREKAQAAADAATQAQTPQETQTPETQDYTEPAETEPWSEEVVYTEPAPSVEGIYYGSMEKYVDMMASTVSYDITIEFAGGTYYYDVQITVSGGMEYSGYESLSGSYSVDGDVLYTSGEITGGDIYGDSIVLYGYFSSFSSGEDSVTVFR